MHIDNLAPRRAPQGTASLPLNVHVLHDWRTGTEDRWSRRRTIAVVALATMVLWGGIFAALVASLLRLL